MITKAYIDALNYPDFVGFINQWNVLPGAHDTISRWAIYGRVDDRSRVLQAACTTGFQSRELARLTGCAAVGVDLSPTAIEMARWNAERYAPQADLTYVNMDAVEYASDERFTHIAVGGGLKFFRDPPSALRSLLGQLKDGGYVLASPFWVTRPVPQSLMRQARDVFGIDPTNTGYDEVMALYRGLDLMYEQRFEINVEPEDEVERYCEATIARACEIRGVTDGAVIDAMMNRLRDVRRVSNLLRPYQNYSTLVLRYSAEQYPNRYVELF
ncbi:class I SAM-dependent methyltransferase [Roseateles sp.]|uniref:class I SAM-dependent methyltransferase n=1 Tax=Roseateles sp. TaxID=1971397 RepID=UPI003D109DFF